MKWIFGYQWGRRCTVCGRIDDGFGNYSSARHQDFLKPEALKKPGISNRDYLSMSEIRKKYPGIDIYKLGNRVPHGGWSYVLLPSYDMCRRKIISKKDLAEHFEANFMIAPGIIEPIAEYRDVYTDEMVDKLFAWKLPVQVCSKKTFLKLVHAALDGNFDTTEATKDLKNEYNAFIKHL